MPFTTSQFLDVFRNYNESLYPVQVLFYILAFVATFLSLKHNSRSGKMIMLILSFFWLWMGIVYHGFFFSSINKMAYVFGALFIIQAFLFILIGVLSRKLTFQFRRDIHGYTGLLFIFFALFIYPMLGSLSTHAYPYAPTFGLPCPTTIFTFGLLLLSHNKLPIALLLIPVLWSIIGMSAALTFGMLEDWFLFIAGMTTMLLTLRRNSKLTQHSGLSTARMGV